MINLFVSENRSRDPVRFARNRVRVFVGRDFTYGLWVDEDCLFDLLSLEQKKEYLTSKSLDLTFEIPLAVAQKVVNLGHTIDSKPRLLRYLMELSA